MHVCFHGLERLWLVCLAVRLSIVILSVPRQPSSALRLRFAPTETLMEQHSSPSWSSWPHIAVAHLSDPLTVSTQADVLTSPAPAPAPNAKAPCNIFILPLGRSVAAMWRSKTGQLQVPAWRLHLWKKMPLSKAHILYGKGYSWVDRWGDGQWVEMFKVLSCVQPDMNSIYTQIHNYYNHIRDRSFIFWGNKLICFLTELKYEATFISQLA